MRYTLLLVFTLIGCSPAGGKAPTTRPTTTPERTQSAAGLLSEPVAESQQLGRLYTVGDLRRLAPITEVKIDLELNAGWAERNGLARITPENFERLLAAAEPVAPGDEVIDGWSYSPW